MEDIMFGGALLLVVVLVAFDPFRQLRTLTEECGERALCADEHSGNSFSAWIAELENDVIQGQYGYEEGEFTVSPDSWRPLFDLGLTPSQAFQRALVAHREA